MTQPSIPFIDLKSQFEVLEPRIRERMGKVLAHGQYSLQAAILLAMLEVFEQEITQRQAVAERYTAALNNALPITPTVAPENTSVWAQYTALSPERDTLRERLQAEGIPSVSYYAVPLHLQPVFAGSGHQPGDFPVAERVASEGLSLPMSAGLSADVVERIASLSA